MILTLFFFCFLSSTAHKSLILILQRLEIYAIQKCDSDAFPLGTFICLATTLLNGKEPLRMKNDPKIQMFNF